MYIFSNNSIAMYNSWLVIKLLNCISAYIAIAIHQLALHRTAHAYHEHKTLACVSYKIIGLGSKHACA